MPSVRGVRISRAWRGSSRGSPATARPGSRTPSPSPSTPTRSTGRTDHEPAGPSPPHPRGDRRGARRTAGRGRPGAPPDRPPARVPRHPRRPRAPRRGARRAGRGRPLACRRRGPDGSHRHDRLGGLIMSLLARLRRTPAETAEAPAAPPAEDGPERRRIARPRGYRDTPAARARLAEVLAEQVEGGPWHAVAVDPTTIT